MVTRLWLALKIYLFWVAFFWVARLVFLAYHHASAGSLGIGAIARVFRAGLRLDLSAAAYLSVVPFILLALSAYRPLHGFSRVVLWIWLVATVVLESLLMATDLELTERWGRRIDASFLQYLSTPREALASMGASPILLLLAIVASAVVVSLWVLRRWVDRPLAASPDGHWVTPLPLLLGIGALVIAGRGGVQTWPLTTSSGYHSHNAFANLAAQNAGWGFFDSVYRHGYDRSNPFRVMPDSTAAAIIAEARFPTADRRLPPVRVARPNVLLVIWESGSARAFGSLGGVPGVTPRFDSLAKTGILFRSFYAAGDRTDKGVAAILSSFPGIPRSSILKTPSKAARLPFLSEIFRQAGYSTGFYYGGELEFASLQAYLVGAGFDRIVGKQDFPAATWNSKWGAHDGVVGERVLADLDRAKQPFFDVWLTLSSHEPFETPEATTISGDDWQSKFFNALAYTDRILGTMIDQARTRDWWTNTVVIVVADHGRRVVPLDQAAPRQGPDTEYRIPMLWLGGALTATDSVVDEVASQLDLAPTLVDLIGGSGEQFRYGRSLFRPVRIPHAYYGFDEGFGITTSTGQLVYDSRGQRTAWEHGIVDESTNRLARALLQRSYQEYLDR